MILALYGFGGLGHELYEMAWQINQKYAQWEQIVAINDFTQEEMTDNVPVYTYERLKSSYSCEQVEISICVGEPQNRKKLYEKVTKDGYKLAALIHPDVHVPATSKIGQGVIITSGVYISTNVSLEDNVLVNVHCVIGHDVLVQSNTVLSPNAALGGKCKVGANSYIGMSVPVKEGITIGSDTVIGMGSVVLRDIPEGVVAMGNPARAMAKNDHVVFKNS